MNVNIENLPKEKQEEFLKKLDLLLNETLVTSYEFRNIKTYDDACKILPVSKNDIVFDCDPDYVVALKQLRHIIKVINQGWTPNWKDNSQPKYYNWFNMASGGAFDCVHSNCGFSYVNATVGSRLFFENREKAEYCAKQFPSLLKTYLMS
jgi:hypothetical protein